jgi:hypothetical protein
MLKSTWFYQLQMHQPVQQAVVSKHRQQQHHPDTPPASANPMNYYVTEEFHSKLQILLVAFLTNINNIPKFISTNQFTINRQIKTN